MVDLRIFTHRHFVVFLELERLGILVKSPFFLTPQCASRPWKSKLFHNSARATLADIDTEITSQNHANLRFSVRFVLHSDLFNQVVYLDTKLTFSYIFRALRPKNRAFQPLLPPIICSSTDADNFWFLFVGNPVTMKQFPLFDLFFTKFRKICFSYFLHHKQVLHLYKKSPFLN